MTCCSCSPQGLQPLTAQSPHLPDSLSHRVERAGTDRPSISLSPEQTVGCAQGVARGGQPQPLQARLAAHEAQCWQSQGYSLRDPQC